ncbi:MAG: TIGR03936 family radical SAM-associated protein [Saccharofermentans sp.]|nr:TIGR03936 family radical SAM-associated protein [Saccharofermentans sp.]
MSKKKYDERVLAMTKQQHLVHYVLRTRFARKGAVSYIGHLDLMNLFGRTVRKSGLPILYSQGFNPRPEMVFALPLGVGIDTEGDYVDISMSVPIQPEEFVEKMTPLMPEGLSIVSVVYKDEPKNSLMSVVTMAEYAIKAPGITECVKKIMEMEVVEVEKKAKGKIVTNDIRPQLLELHEDASLPDCVEVLVKAGSTSNLRPESLLQACTRYAGLDPEDASNAGVTRLCLYGGEYPNIKRIEEFT